MTPRTRRTAQEAKRRILERAEQHLIEGGPSAVRVQVIAKELGITDAAIHHHFGNRDGLFAALLRRAGRGLRDAMREILEGWDGDPKGLHQLAHLIASTYADRGYARLALWLVLGGQNARGSGMFTPLVDALHAARLQLARTQGTARPRRQDVAHAVALLNLAFIAEPVAASAFLRSVDIDPDPAARARFRAWLIPQLVAILLPEAS